MHVCLVGWSALECWRSIRALGVEYTAEVLGFPRMRPVGGCGLSLKRADAKYLQETWGLTLPLEAGVFGAGHARSSDTVWTKLINPNDQFVELSPGVLLSAPEHIPDQLARVLGPRELIWVGYELTSVFALRNDKRIDSVPLIESLNSRLQVTQKLMRYVREGCASPPEIEMSMKFGLGSRYGGFGLRNHEMNPEVQLSETAQLLAGKGSCRPDLLLAGTKIDVEYDSYEWHSGDNKQAEDARRRHALEFDGYTVIPVDFSLLRDVDRMTEFARDLHRRTGSRFRPRSSVFLKEQAALFNMFKNGPLVKKSDIRKNVVKSSDIGKTVGESSNI